MMSGIEVIYIYIVEDSYRKSSIQKKIPTTEYVVGTTL